MEYQIKLPGARHAYTVEIEPHNGIRRVHVECANRDQAARLCVRHGFTVRSVNMIG